MKRILIPLVLACSQAGHAADFGGYVALTTDYVKRGITQTNGDPALQLGAEVTIGSGFFVGLWASNVDISNGPSRQRDLEANYYAGYGFDLSDLWRVTVGAIAYSYPGQTGSVNYDYQELSIAANFDDRLWLEVAHSPDLYNSGQSTTNVDLYAEWPLNRTWAIGGGGGYYDTSKLTGSGYQYWQLGVTASLRWADIDLRVHDTSKSVPIISTPERAESRLVLKIQVPF
jgi:uncharacterized protein (TIGR02001 family)